MSIESFVAGTGVGAAVVAGVVKIVSKLIDRRPSPVAVAGDVVDMVERQLQRLDERVTALEAENAQLRRDVGSARDAERDCRRRMAILAGIMADAGLPIPQDVVGP